MYTYLAYQKSIIKLVSLFSSSTLFKEIAELENENEFLSRTLFYYLIFYKEIA